MQVLFIENIYSSGIPFDINSLDFDEIPIPTITAGQNDFLWVKVGMPKLPENYIETTFYLYHTREGAEKGEKYGGTGFYVGITSRKHPHIVYVYGVSNYHVVKDDGASIIRVNLLNGKNKILEYRSDQWEFIPGGGDVAISPILSPLEDIQVAYVHIDSFATDKEVKDLRINVGDDVFMIGRFIDYDGGNTNLPAVRFGHISVMPTYIPHESNNLNGPNYILDMHSRTGFSGSAVFVYRTAGADLDYTNRTKELFSPLGTFLYLLGIHRGQFPETWKDEKGKAIKGSSGMTCVIPAERILSLINKPNLRKQRYYFDSQREEYYKKHGYPPIPE